MERMESAARSWILAVLEGTVGGIPLTREQLRLGFTLFDWDGDGNVDSRSFVDVLNKLNPESKTKYTQLATTSGVLGKYTSSCVWV